MIKRGPIEWEEADPNEEGVQTIAWQKEDWCTDEGKHIFDRMKVVGLNGILKGARVRYEGEEYRVVVVSSLGHLCMSTDGCLPYTQRIQPLGVELIEQGDPAFEPERRPE